MAMHSEARDHPGHHLGHCHQAEGVNENRQRYHYGSKGKVIDHFARSGPLAMPLIMGSL
jgi:hypothetical protein